MKVKLINSTVDPELLIATAAKLCYSSSDVESLMEKQTPEGVQKFLKMLTEIGHASPIEHVSFTFAIEGVSRSLTHQLVRHRIASYSQPSQRYVKEAQFEYIIPPAIEAIPLAKEKFIRLMEEDQKTYNEIVQMLKDKYISEGMGEKPAEKKAIEDARYVFPNACETKIIVTMNARSLMNFFEHRCCFRAQWEIREMAKQMLSLCKKASPTLFKNAGASCRTHGYCPEGDMQCDELKGKIPTIKDIKKILKERV